MRAYEEACEQNQKRPLAALICAAENRSSVSFNLSATKPVHCFHYKHIQDVVSELTELQELTLSGYMLEQPVVQAVLQGLSLRDQRSAISQCAPLEVLRFENHPSFATGSFPMLCATLDSCVEPMREPIGTYIKRLEFAKVGLDTDALNCIKSTFSCRNLPNLDHILVEKEDFSDPKDCACLVEVILTSTNVSNLSFISCRVNNQGFEKILLRLSQAQRRMTFLGMEDNDISEYPINQSSKLMKPVHIEQINLSNNRFSTLGARQLARALYTESFLNIDLSSQKGGSLSGETLEEFSRYISNPNCSLQSISLRGIELNERGLIALGKGLSANSSVKRCDVTSDSVLDECTLKLFAEALVSNSTLLELNLSSIPESIRDGIDQILELNRKLDAIMKRQKSREERGSPKAIPRREKNRTRRNLSPKVVSGLSDLYIRAEEELSHFGSPPCRRSPSSVVDSSFLQKETETKSDHDLSHCSIDAAQPGGSQGELLARVAQLEERIEQLTQTRSPTTRRLELQIQGLESKLTAVSRSNSILQSLAESLVESMKDMEKKVKRDENHPGIEESLLRSGAVQQMVERALASTTYALDGNLDYASGGLGNGSSLLAKQVNSVVARLDLLQKSVVEERENNIRTLELLTARDF